MRCKKRNIPPKTRYFNISLRNPRLGVYCLTPNYIFAKKNLTYFLSGKINVRAKDM